jgi:ABC-type transport system involved in cytochrome c biogenesis permease subunit
MSESTYYYSAFIFYAIAIISYIVYIVRKRRALWKSASIISIIGFLPHTIGLIIRWINSGHPPFSNIFEMLICFAWGIVLINLIVEYRFKFKESGIFVLPLALAILAIAFILPGKDARPLMPALQSYWLYIHVATGIISYSAFAAAFAFSLAYLMKTRVPPQSFGVWLTGIATITYAVIGKFSIITSANYFMPRVVATQEKGKTIYYQARDLVGYYLKQGYTQEQLKNLYPLNIKIPLVGKLFLACFILFAAAFILYLLSFLIKRYHFDNTASMLTGAGFLLQVVSGTILTYQICKLPEVHLASNPFDYIIIIFVTILMGLFIGFQLKHEHIINRLPESKLFDTLTYRSISIGFPFLTFLIITGAIWAQKAWGSYWSNDPKEWWSAITWLVYAIYLHTRIVKGWAGKRSAYFAVIGFLFVIFTLFGVTYLLPGLHAYI